MNIKRNQKILLNISKLNNYTNNMGLISLKVFYSMVSQEQERLCQQKLWQTNQESNSFIKLEVNSKVSIEVKVVIISRICLRKQETINQQLFSQMRSMPLDPKDPNTNQMILLISYQLSQMDFKKTVKQLLLEQLIDLILLMKP